MVEELNTKTELSGQLHILKSWASLHLLKCKCKITSKGLNALNEYGEEFYWILLDIWKEGFMEISRTSNPSNLHWVEEHYRYDGMRVSDTNVVKFFKI